jgi:hypothetical protein
VAEHCGPALIRAPALGQLIQQLVALDVLEKEIHVPGVLIGVDETADARMVE